MVVLDLEDCIGEECAIVRREAVMILGIVWINCMGLGIMRLILEYVVTQKRVAKIDIEEAFSNVMRQDVK